MKLLKTLCVAGLVVAQENGSGEDELDVAPRKTRMELVEPLYQECEAPSICGAAHVPARCRNMGESCAQSDSVNNPCDFHCVTECPTGQASVIVTGPSGGTFKKCVNITEITEMSNFVCSSPEGATPQFEMQVPKITRHKYIEDNRNYTLVPFYEEGILFEKSNCFASDEDEHFVTFRGALEGQSDCQINHWIEYEDNHLFDVYKATVGYDDLTGVVGDSQNVVYRKGAHYEFECKVKRSDTVTSDIFPFVDGRREVTLLNDQTETKFEMVRCKDESCQEAEFNGVIDISPNSMDDPMVWFKVEALTTGRYAHLRECYYSFDDGETSDEFDVIQNGCSSNQPITVLNETRTVMEYDVFGQVMFMHQKPDATKVSISCIVDACLPPALGVYSCDVESACAGRYDELYGQFLTSNDVALRRKRRRSTSGALVDEAVVTFDTYHPCHLIKTDEKTEVCPSDTNEPCWTEEICEKRFNKAEVNLHQKSASAKVYAATLAFAGLVLM